MHHLRLIVFLHLFLLVPSLAIAADNQYLEIPLCGIFSEPSYRIDDQRIAKRYAVESTDNTSPEIIERTLEFASKNGIKHIVFRIDSPGGLLSTAEEIVDIMAKYDDVLEYHALVKKGLSASIWIIFACDMIYVTSDSVIGAAVPYTNYSGAVQVDEKFNSAIAAKLATIAESKGHSTVLLRAMILQGAAVYASTGKDGTTNISNVIPTETKGISISAVDTAETVLTLTGQEAVKFGLAKFAPNNALNLGEMIGVEGWVLANHYVSMSTLFDFYFHNPPAIKRYFWSAKQQKDLVIPPRQRQEVDGVTIVVDRLTTDRNTSNSRRAALTRNFNRKLRNVAEIIKLIEQSDPELTSYEYSASGKLTPDSAAKRRRRMTESVALWKRLHRELSKRTSIKMEKTWEVYKVIPSQQALPTEPGDPPAAVQRIWQMKKKP